MWNEERAALITNKQRHDKVDLITTEDRTDVIKKIKDRKSLGSDGFNNELFKYVLNSFLVKFFDFINIYWIYGNIPEEWRIAVKVPIYIKNVTSRVEKNYRGIIFLNTGHKICVKMITQRLMMISDSSKNRMGSENIDRLWIVCIPNHL